ncbi:MAG: LysR family transcriptional regulator [Betaproteobacteria bacterium]|nr:LysR family transcriptional regulator [Betaproteobacteria bacterium]
MELYQIKTFAAVAELGHLTRAAERLHLSQPAVSAHVKALEDELGVRLFERTSSGMVLTHAGRELLRHADRVLAAVENLRRAARALKGEITAHLRIGSVIDPDFLRLGDFLSRAVERHPGLDLEVHHEVSGAALEAVRAGELDASFYFGDIAHAEVSGLALRELAYRVTAPAEWADRVRGADWAQIAAQPWILPPAISTMTGLARALFAEHGVAPARLIEADNELVIANLVASGVGLSLMREEVALEKQQAGEVVVWDKVRPRTTLWFIHPASRADDPPITALLEVLRETWGLPAETATA